MRPTPLPARPRATLLRLAAVLALCGSLSSCIVTTLTVAGYYRVAGVGDHKAHVSEAWRGPQGELAIALEDLEGAGGTEDTLLVITADELEQMLAGQAASGPSFLPVPHVRLPRTILFRALALPRPEPGAPTGVAFAEWDTGQVHVPPEPPPGAELAVHWTHHYRTGAPEETGFALLLTRTTPGGSQHALLLPERFRQPAWTNVMIVLALAADVTWIVLLLA